MDPISAILLTLGAAFLFGSWVLLLVTSWNEDYSWGLCTTLLPPLSYLYALFRLDKAADALIVAAIGAAFWLGWTLATADRESGPGVNGSATGAVDSAHPQVNLQLDAGSLTLVPDADLHLKPLPTLDPDALYRDSLDAGAAPTHAVPSTHTKP